MVFGIDDALLAAGIQAGGSLLSGYLAGNQEPRETSQTQTQTYTPTRIDRKKDRLIEQLLRGVSGRGRFADLYSPSEEVFQKSFVEPSLQRYENQIAPQIRQQYLNAGQEGGTAMEDQLLRAGVDLNSMLDEKYAGFYQDAQSRKQNAINSILGFSGTPGVRTTTSISNQPGSEGSWGQATAGYLSSNNFADTLSRFMQPSENQSRSTASPTPTPRKGFERPWGNDWGVGDRRWG